MPASKLLSVPYYTQPDATTCQSTVLKMMASYLERTVTSGGTVGATRHQPRRTGDGSAGTYFLLFPDAMQSVP